MSKFPNPEELPVLDEIPWDTPVAPEEPYEPPPAPPRTLHHVEVVAQGCVVEVLLNDMPMALVTGSDPAQAAHFAPPANPYLCAADNVLEIRVSPLEESDDARIPLADAEVEVNVPCVAKGDPVAPGAGPFQFRATVHDELRQRIAESREREAEGEDPDFDVPAVFFHLFDACAEAPPPDFSPELRDADPYDDPEALRDYAIHLRDLARAGDAAGLSAEMEPKVLAYAAAYDEAPEPIRDSLLEVLRSDLLPLGIQPFEREEVVLVSCCGGRVWWLRRDGDAPLLQTPPTEEGATRQLEVLVALRDGELKVVR